MSRIPAPKGVCPLDLNITVLAGRLATDPEIRTFPSGTCLIRYLVTVRTERPRRRVDVLPVTLWDPSAEDLADPGERGTPVFVVGAVQRRFWSEGRGRTSRVEIIAHAVECQPRGDAEREEHRATA